MTTAAKIVDALLEAEPTAGHPQPPAAAPEGAVTVPKSKVDRLNRAIKAAADLEELLHKEKLLVRQMIYALRIETSLEALGVTRDDIAELLTHDFMRGKSLGGRVSKFRKEFDVADTDVIGVRTKDGRELFFDSPIRPSLDKQPARWPSNPYTGEVPPKKKKPTGVESDFGW